jgi:hypothetical protein
VCFDMAELPTFLAPEGFKMETLSSVLPLFKKGMFLAKVDLKSTHHSVPVHT